LLSRGEGREVCTGAALFAMPPEKIGVSGDETIRKRALELIATEDGVQYRTK
jgi:hypothetical protein